MLNAGGGVLVLEGGDIPFKSLEQLEKHDSLNTLKKHESTGFALRCYPVGHDRRLPRLALHDRWLSLPTIEQMVNKIT